MTTQDTQPSQQSSDSAGASAAPLERTRTICSWEVAGLSHPGLVRTNNEDHFMIARLGRFMEPVSTNLPASEIPPRAEEIAYAFVVADGLGGHAAGEVASRSAITVLWQLALDTPDWILRLDDETYIAEAMRRAKDRCEKVDIALAQQGLLEPRLEGMATTLTLAATVGNTVVLTHVGDSRAYLVRRGRLFQVTRDHTHVQQLIDQKVISHGDASTHRLRHVLTNALGAIDKDVDPDVQRLSLLDGDCLLLCTDGLSSYVEEWVIAAILQSGDTPEHICQRLVDEALKAGGKDNVTVILGRSRTC